MPKPTILLALDPHSAAFCTAIKLQLQKFPADQTCLIQTYNLTWDGQTFGFSGELDRFADTSFDLAQTHSKQAYISKIRTQFSDATGELQTALIELLKTASQSKEAIAAKRQGVEISSSHRVYLMLSASNQFARGVVFDIVRLIRWLFSKYFTDIPYSLEALLLLPGLFTQATTTDYGAAYAFLKELDYKMIGGVVITGSQKVPPFDNCWLMDERIGGLSDNLPSYADALAGFLTVEPETNGLLLGAQKVRGKIPAYSSFGYGELFFAGETTINRLSAAFAADIIREQFLPKAEFTPEASRKCLLDAKGFVLSEDFSNAFLQLERDNGKPVWQDFNPRIEIHAGMAREYGMELQRAYRQFENKELLSYKRTLEKCCKQLQANLTSFLDRSINSYVDATPRGLHEGVRLLNILTFLYLELQTDAIGDQSQNLVTELRTAEAFLDSRLQVTIDPEATQKLLNQVLSLKLRQQQLQDALTERKSEEQLQELQTTQKQLETAVADYRQGLNAEIEQARQIRFMAIARAREQAEAAIVVAQNHLTAIENQLETATDNLDELLTEENRFRSQYLIVYPILVTGALFALLILTGIFSQSTLWLLLQKFWANLVTYLLWTAVTILTYLGIVWLKYSTNLRDRIQKVQKQIKRLESTIKATAVELRRSYNEQLKLEYDLYAQNLRVEALNYLIKTAKQRTETLRQTLADFSEIHNNLVAQRDRATTKFSEIRLTVLTDADIDAYYQSFLSTLPTEKFTQEQVSRSQSWKISAEEFQNQLIPFARQQFEQLGNLSIGEVLKQSDLIAANTANLRLNQLYDSANLLLRIQDIDTNLNPTSQREITLWVGAKDKEQIFSFYSRFSRSLTALVAEDKQRLYILTRSLGFPAYFLSQIEYYRDCYERTQSEQIDEDENIPDLIPEEIGSGRELKLAYQTVILAIALGLLSQHSQGYYQFKSRSIGKDREQIALALATEFTLQELYGELEERIETFEGDFIYHKLQEFGTSASSLNPYERKLLDHLLSDYNPLN
ncbi:Chromosome partition protein Smc [Nostoc sp. DSM 114160]|jgi:septal ring factor EnvC (AmiA/AmiB activator)